MNDVTKIAVGVFLGLYAFVLLVTAIAALEDDGGKSLALRTAEAVEKIAAECAVVAREKEGGN